MKGLRSALGASAALLVLTGSGFSQEGKRPEPARPERGSGEVQTRAAPATLVRRASSVLGSSVVLRGGAAYGKVEDLVLDRGGRIDYAVITDGGDYILVPWWALTVDFQERMVRIDATREALKAVTFSRE
jgi:hypothetical protein